jgi:hypothetical protein
VATKIHVLNIPSSMTCEVESPSVRLRYLNGSYSDSLPDIPNSTAHQAGSTSASQWPASIADYFAEVLGTT